MTEKTAPRTPLTDERLEYLTHPTNPISHAEVLSLIAEVRAGRASPDGGRALRLLVEDWRLKAETFLALPEVARGALAGCANALEATLHSSPPEPREPLKVECPRCLHDFTIPYTEPPPAPPHQEDAPSPDPLGPWTEADGEAIRREVAENTRRKDKP